MACLSVGMLIGAIVLTGTMLNALGILVGGLLGLMRKGQFSPSTQLALRGFMGVFTIYTGLSFTVNALRSSSVPVYKQVLILLLAMMSGNLLGKLLRIQKTL